MFIISLFYTFIYLLIITLFNFLSVTIPLNVIGNYCFMDMLHNFKLSLLLCFTTTKSDK